MTSPNTKHSTPTRLSSDTRHSTLHATVFVIDDDASIRRSLSRLLRSAGYASEAFSSAEEFLRREHFDGAGCILLDVKMPGLSGMDLQEELNKADYHMPIESSSPVTETSP